MNSFKDKARSKCGEFRAQFEDAASAAPDSKNLMALLADAAVPLLPSSSVLAGPWFAQRVTAAIAARTAELSRVADTWTFLPKLAARLTWACSIALLLASGWLYQRPHASPPTAVATDITGEPISENATPAAEDELLFSLVEKERPRR